MDAIQQQVNTMGYNVNRTTAWTIQDAEKASINALKSLRVDVSRVSENVYLSVEMFTLEGKFALYHTGDMMHESKHVIRASMTINADDNFVFKVTRYAYGVINTEISFNGDSVSRKSTQEIKTVYYVSEDRITGVLAYMEKSKGSYVTALLDASEKDTINVLISKFIKRANTGDKPLNQRLSVYPYNVDAKGKPSFTDKSRVTIYGSFLLGKGKPDSLLTSFGDYRESVVTKSMAHYVRDMELAYDMANEENASRTPAAPAPAAAPAAAAKVNASASASKRKSAKS